MLFKYTELVQLISCPHPGGDVVAEMLIITFETKQKTKTKNKQKSETLSSSTDFFVECLGLMVSFLLEMFYEVGSSRFSASFCFRVF